MSSRLKSRVFVFTLVFFAVVTFDQVSKSWALRHFQRHAYHVIGFVRLDIVLNKGAAFGIGNSWGPWIVVLAVIAFWIIAVTARKELLSGAPVAFALISAGAFSNLGDRIARGHHGAVVDFIDFGWWPSFNLADAAIVIGVIYLLIFQGRKS